MTPNIRGHTLTHLCRIHDKISDICLLTEEFFSAQILIIVLVTFADMLQATFRLLEVAVLNRQLEDVKRVNHVHSMHIVFWVAMTLGIISVSVSVVKEVREKVQYFFSDDEFRPLISE